MAPTGDPIPPIAAAQKPFIPRSKPMKLETKEIGPTTTPASADEAPDRIKDVMIIPRTFTPQRCAIFGLKAEATRAMPNMVFEKKYHRRNMEITAAPITATLWDCMLEFPRLKISCEKNPE